MWKPPGTSKIRMNYPLKLFVILATCRLASSLWDSTPKPPYRFRNFEDDYIFGLAVRMGGFSQRPPLGWTGNPTIPTRPSTTTTTTTPTTTTTTTTTPTTTTTTTPTTTTPTTTTTTKPPTTTTTTTTPTPTLTPTPTTTTIPTTTTPTTATTTTTTTTPLTPKPFITECYVCDIPGVYNMLNGTPITGKSNCNTNKVTCAQNYLGGTIQTAISARPVCISLTGDMAFPPKTDSWFPTGFDPPVTDITHSFCANPSRFFLNDIVLDLTNRMNTCFNVQELEDWSWLAHSKQYSGKFCVCDTSNNCNTGALGAGY